MLSPRCVEFMLSREKGVGNFDNFIKGPMHHQIFEEVLGDGIFAVDGESWSSKRKVASHMFSARYYYAATIIPSYIDSECNDNSVLNNQMERTFLAHGRTFVDLIASLPKDKPFDIQNLFFRFTMDSICEIAFGKKLDSLHQYDPLFH
jgi:cytochrome P450